MFAGRTYWIVGASEGLGAALAAHLDQLGAYVILSARSKTRLENVAKGLSNAKVVPIDVTDEASVQNAAAKAGPIDGVIYCAGAYDPIRAQDWKPGQTRTMIEVNFTGAMHVLEHLMQGFMTRGQGHIVLIGSLAGHRGLPGAIGYGASKAGMMHLGESLYADLRQTDIKVQVINPGFIKTRLTDKNDFTMPQIMTPEVAANHVVRAMQSGRFETSFPKPFSWLFTVGRFLPNWLFYGIFKPASQQDNPAPHKVQPGE